MRMGLPDSPPEKSSYVKYWTWSDVSKASNDEDINDGEDRTARTSDGDDSCADDGRCAFATCTLMVSTSVLVVVGKVVPRFTRNTKADEERATNASRNPIN